MPSPPNYKAQVICRRSIVCRYSRIVRNGTFRRRGTNLPARQAIRRGHAAAGGLRNAEPDVVKSVNPRPGLGATTGTSDGWIRRRVAIDAITAGSISYAARQIGEL